MIAKSYQKKKLSIHEQIASLKHTPMVKDPNSILIKTTYLSRNRVGGPAYFDADGMLTLGDRFARGMLQLLMQK